MKKSNWIWMPHAGHFICGDRCKFHLTTYVGKYIVSTIGEMWNERGIRDIHAEIYNPQWFEANKHLRGDTYDAAYMKEFGYEEIGAGRKYETMVFKAKKATEYLCCPYRIENGQDIDMDGYNEAEDAYKGHMRMCKKWGGK